jgi:hypothetical protein
MLRSPPPFESGFQFKTNNLARNHSSCEDFQQRFTRVRTVHGGLSSFGVSRVGVGSGIAGYVAEGTIIVCKCIFSALATALIYVDTSMQGELSGYQTGFPGNIVLCIIAVNLRVAESTPARLLQLGFMHGAESAGREDYRTLANNLPAAVLYCTQSRARVGNYPPSKKDNGYQSISTSKRATHESTERAHSVQLQRYARVATA